MPARCGRSQAWCRASKPSSGGVAALASERRARSIQAVACCVTPIAPSLTANHWRRISRTRCGAKYASPTMRTVWRYRKQSTARRTTRTLCLRRFSGRASGAASRSASASSRAATTSPENGDTIRCHGRHRTSCRARSAIAGEHGCIETFLCGPAFAAEFARATGRTLSAPEICSAAEADDAQALAALARYEDRLGRALAAVVNLLDPDAIVLGGGLSNVARLYTNVPVSIERYAICRPINITLVRAHWGDSSGVRGAAWLYS